MLWGSRVRVPDHFPRLVPEHSATRMDVPTSKAAELPLRSATKPTRERRIKTENSSSFATRKSKGTRAWWECFAKNAVSAAVQASCARALPFDTLCTPARETLQHQDILHRARQHAPVQHSVRKECALRTALLCAESIKCAVQIPPATPHRLPRRFHRNRGNSLAHGLIDVRPSAKVISPKSVVHSLIAA